MNVSRARIRHLPSILLLASHPVGIENQGHGTRAVARGRGRRVATADSVPTLVHDPGPTTDVSVRRLDRLVATRPVDLHTFASGRRGPEECLLRGDLALLVR